MSVIYNKQKPGVAGTHVFIVGVASYPNFPGYTAENLLGQIDSALSGALAIADWFIDDFDNPITPLHTVRVVLAGEIPAEYRDRYGKAQQGATFEQVKQEYVAWMNDLRSVEGNVAVFYFAGHGFGTDERQCLLLEDFNKDSLNATDGAVNYNNLVHSVRCTKNLSHAWFFVDACRQVSLEDVARDEWGRKVNSKLLPLAGPTSCNQLFAAAPGEAALGVAGASSFFSEALIEALEKNGYSRGRDADWVVQIGSLQTAVAMNMQRLCQIAKVADDEIPRVSSVVVDSLVELHYRDANSPPAFLVKVTCNPETHNIRYTFTCTSEASEPMGSRAPHAQPWYTNLQPGKYTFEAADSNGTSVIQRSEHIYLSYLEIRLKGKK